MVRVVRPGGRVAVLELTPMCKGGLSGVLRWYFHHVVPFMGSVVAGDRAAYTYLPQSVDQFVEAGALARRRSENRLGAQPGVTSSVSVLAGYATRPRFVAIGAPISARCRGKSFKE